MHEVRLLLSIVAVYASLDVTPLNSLHCAKTVERIKILFEMNNPVGPGNIVLHGGPDPRTERGGGVWKNILNCGPTTYFRIG